MANNLPENRLIALAELLFMPMVFYVLVQWGKMDSWQSKVLWLMIFALIQNEFLSVRTSYRIYTVTLYLFDLVSLVVYIVCIDALAKKNTIIGYDPKFWIFISILWAGYAIWDFKMAILEENVEMKKKYKEWCRNMILFFILTLLCGVGIVLMAQGKVNQNTMYAIYILQAIPFSLILWSLTWWIRDLSSAFEG